MSPHHSDQMSLSLFIEGALLLLGLLFSIECTLWHVIVDNVLFESLSLLRNMFPSDSHRKYQESLAKACTLRSSEFFWNIFVVHTFFSEWKELQAQDGWQRRVQLVVMRARALKKRRRWERGKWKGAWWHWVNEEEVWFSQIHNLLSYFAQLGGRHG